MAQQVKRLLLSLLWLWLHLRHGFDPWPGNFCMLWAQAKKKKKKSTAVAPESLEENQLLASFSFLKLPVFLSFRPHRSDFRLCLHPASSSSVSSELPVPQSHQDTEHPL